MKVEFLRPKFDGARFSEHTLPLEVARDLAAYETLVIELAKHLYMQENPTRQRVAKGFGADFHLHLEKVDSGSAIPVLAVVAASALPMNDVSNPYFERARDLVAECVAAPINNLPDEFPRELLTHFNQLGRSLRDGESLTLSSNAILTRQRRKELVLAASRVYEQEAELFGSIEEIDFQKSTFRLRLNDGKHAIIPMTEKFHVTARQYGGRKRVGVTVKAIGNYDSWDRLQKVVNVISTEIQPHYELATRFELLASLENGWFEGAGLAPDKEQLSTLVEQFLAGYPEDLDLPSVFPTQDGNLLLEWKAPGSPSVDIELASLKAEFHAFAPDGTDIEQDFVLDTNDNFAAFFDFLSDNVESTNE